MIFEPKKLVFLFILPGSQTTCKLLNWKIFLSFKTFYWKIDPPYCSVFCTKGQRWACVPEWQMPSRPRAVFLDFAFAFCIPVLNLFLLVFILILPCSCFVFLGRVFSFILKLRCVQKKWNSAAHPCEARSCQLN